MPRSARGLSNRFDYRPPRGASSGPQTVTGSAGISSGETFGSGGKVAGPVKGVTGITSAETFGSGGIVRGNITGPLGIPSAEHFGTGGIVAGPVKGVAGIPSAEHFGSGGSLIYTITISGSTGIISAEAFGAGSGGSVSNVIHGSAGIPSAEHFGSGGKVISVIAGVIGIPSEEKFGLSGFVLGPPGVGTNFKVFAGGSNQANILAGSIQVSRQMNFAGTAGLMLWDEGGTLLPAVGEEVVFFYWTGTAWVKYFGGSVDETDLAKYQSTDNPTGQASEIGKRFWTIKCVDYAKALARRLVVKSYSQANFGTLNSILQDLSDTYLAPEGIHWVPGVDPGITIPDTNFNFQALNSVLDTLASITNLNWLVDWDRNFYMSDTPAPLSDTPFDITSTSNNARNFNVTRSRGLYRNRQYIDSDTGAPSNSITKTYDLIDVHEVPYNVIANGLALIDRQYDGLVQNIQDIKLNGTSIPFSTIAQQSAPGYDASQFKMGQVFSADRLAFYWNLFTFPADIPSPGDTITITFTTNQVFSNLTFVENPTEIAARKAIEGGSGLYEDVFKVNGISDTAALLTLAQSLLDKFGVMALEVDYETDVFGLECGSQQNVTLEKFDISTPTPLRVESIDSHEMDTLILRNTVKVSNRVQQLDAMSAINRLIKKLQQQVPQQTQPISFNLAETIQGLTNPGLIVGTNLTTEYIVTQLFTCKNVQISFKTPPVGASITIDILVNGVSIMEFPMHYSVLGGVQEYTFFANVPQVLRKGQKISINVNSVGTIQPGQDGTVMIFGVVGQ